MSPVRQNSLDRSRTEKYFGPVVCISLSGTHLSVGFAALTLAVIAAVTLTTVRTIIDRRFIGNTNSVARGSNDTARIKFVAASAQMLPAFLVCFESIEFSKVLEF